MARLFLCVDVSHEAAAQAGTLRRPWPAARWTDPAHLHLTLRFLGEVADDRLGALRASLAGVRAPAFSLALAGVGVFPPPGAHKPARVLWTGVAPPAPLVALHNAVTPAVDAVLGPDPEGGRPYFPHLTLARFKERPGPTLPAFLADHASFRSAAFPVTAFHLYRSTLRPTSALHEVIEVYPLGGTAG